LDGCVGSTELLPVTLKHNILNITIEYLWVILRSKITLDQWKYQVTGSTPSRYRIGKREIDETIILLSEDKIQNEYSSKIIKLIKQNANTNIKFMSNLESNEKKYTENILKK
jgi:hypothetical protein